MSRRVLLLFFAAVVFAFLAIPSWSKSDSGVLRTTIDLSGGTSLNSTALAAGEYRVTVDGDKAKFERDGKVVAEAPCTLKELPAKAAHTEVAMDGDRLTEIQIAGKTQAIEFSSGRGSGN